MDDRINCALDLLREALSLFSDVAYDDNVDAFTRGLACGYADVLRAVRDTFFDHIKGFIS